MILRVRRKILKLLRSPAGLGVQVRRPNKKMEENRSTSEHVLRLSGYYMLGNVVISKKFLRTRKIMVMYSNERGVLSTYPRRPKAEALAQRG